MTLKATETLLIFQEILIAALAVSEIPVKPNRGVSDSPDAVTSQTPLMQQLKFPENTSVNSSLKYKLF